MNNQTPADALRDVIEALDACPFCGCANIISHADYFDPDDPHVGCSECGASNHRDNWNNRSDTIRRALATLAAVEAAPVGDVYEMHDGRIVADAPGAMSGQRVALVRVGEG